MNTLCVQLVNSIYQHGNIFASLNPGGWRCDSHSHISSKGQPSSKGQTVLVMPIKKGFRHSQVIVEDFKFLLASFKLEKEEETLEC